MKALHPPERSPDLPDTTPSDADLLERFVTRRDERAFSALLVRHGPMVFGVCRRLLRQVQDAEDAFQATFLVLANKAGSIRRRELLGNWLYGVASRVAARARRIAVRRQAREVADMERIAEAAREQADPPELPGVLQEEVQRLPAKYRGPIVLCYLEGRTNEEAAAELCWPIGTVKGRLARAREMLRKRLTRRGLVLSTAAFSAALLAEASAASLPPALIDSTLRAAAGGLVSVQAAALTKGVLHTMFVSKMKTVAAFGLALAMIVGGAGVFAYHTRVTEPPAKKTDKENIQGTWKVVSFRMNGQDPKDGDGARIKKSTFEITDDKMFVRFNDEVRESTYKLDPAARPKTIDMSLTLSEGEKKGKTMPGLYKLEGDTLTICIPYAREGGRPTEFVSKEDSNTGLIVLKRVKK